MVAGNSSLTSPPHGPTLQSQTGFDGCVPSDLIFPSNVTSPKSEAWKQDRSSPFVSEWAVFVSVRFPPISRCRGDIACARARSCPHGEYKAK